MNPLLWHGAAMAAAWLVLLPAGALVARFFKVRPGQDYPYELDDKVWWNAHRAVQVAGTALAALGFWIAWEALGRELDGASGHVQLGMVALFLLAVQVLSPIWRGTKGGPTERHADPYDPETWGGDHFDMTVRRQVFEFLHKRMGYVGMAVAVCAAWTGIDLVGLGAWWKAGVVASVAGFAGLFGWFTAQGRRVDTWDAIWGPHGR